MIGGLIDLKEKLQQLTQHRFFRAILTLFSGSLIGQLVSVASSLFTSRLFTDYEIGIYTLMTTAVTLFSSVACFKYEPSIVVAEDDDEAYDLLSLCLTLCGGTTLVFAVGYCIYLWCKPEIWASAGIFSLLTIAVFFLTGVNDIMYNYNTRFQNYGLISKAYAWSSTVKYSMQIALGYFGFSTDGMKVSSLTGTALGTYFHLHYLWGQKDKLHLRGKEARSRMKKVAVKYRRQPLFAAPSYFVQTASFQVLNFLIEMLYGFATFGIYSLAYRMLNVPITLIGNNVARVLFFKNAAEEYNTTGGYRKSLLTTTLALTAIAIPMVILLCLLSPWLFSLFFGEAWRMSGVYAIYQAPMYGVRLVVQPLTQALVICRKQNIELFIQGAFLICSAIAFIYCRMAAAPMEVFLILISISYSFFYLVLYGAIYLFGKKKA